MYEIRMGAVSIIGFQARSKKISEQTKKGLFELLLNIPDRINKCEYKNA